MFCVNHIFFQNQAGTVALSSAMCHLMYVLLQFTYLITVKPILSGPRIKQRPSVKLKPARFLKFSSYIYRKSNLYSADSSIKWMQTTKLGHFVTQNLYYSRVQRVSA